MTGRAHGMCGSGCGDINVSFDNLADITDSGSNGTRGHQTPASPTTTNTYTTTIHAYTTTTTTPASTPEAAEDLRRRITSPVTAAILVSLLQGPADTGELLEAVERLTGRRLSVQALYKYLYYYQSKGWLSRGSPLWGLTESGYTFACKYARTLSRLVGVPLSVLIQFCKTSEGLTSVEVSRKRVEESRKQVEEILQRGKSCSTLEKFESIKEELTSEEREVLEALVRHKCKWGSNYRYFEELAEDLSIPARELLRILTRLQSKRLVYIYEDKRKGTARVGLGRALR